MKNCIVCQLEIESPAYVSANRTSLSSLCKLIEGETRIYFCERCGHLQTEPLPSLEKYYDEGYKILANSEEEDQVYKVIANEPVFRSAHQTDTLLAKLSLKRETKILDYGCGKSATLKKLTERIPGLIPHLFDVSRDYIPYWEKFTKSEFWATYAPKPTWNNYFDVVTAFFALEHVADPITELRAIHKLLKPNGELYFIVPDVLANSADLIVAEHVNHFTAVSIPFCLSTAGFQLVEIDSKSHEGAHIVIAKKLERAAKPVWPKPAVIADLTAKVEAICKHYKELGARIRAFEKEYGFKGGAIYGAGFYGSFIATSLQDISKIRVFVDQNPHLQGKTHFEKPIVAPAELPDGIETLYIGLNPAHAKNTISHVLELRPRKLNYFFL